MGQRPGVRRESETLRLRKTLKRERGSRSTQFGTDFCHDLLRRINILAAADAGGPVLLRFHPREHMLFAKASE